jgi:hypothetical protein
MEVLGAFQASLPADDSTLIELVLADRACRNLVEVGEGGDGHIRSP